MRKLLFTAAIFLSVALVFTACSGVGSNAKTEQFAKDERYTCTMHNEVMSNHHGKYPKSGMQLVKQKTIDEQMKKMKDETSLKPEN